MTEVDATPVADADWKQLNAIAEPNPLKMTMNVNVNSTTMNDDLIISMKDIEKVCIKMKIDTIILITMTIIGLIYLWVCGYIVYLVDDTWMLFPVIAGIFVEFYITMVVTDSLCVMFGKD